MNCCSKYYNINFYEDHIEIDIINIPSDNYYKGKLYFDLILFYKIDNNNIINYNGKIFHNEQELKYFFKHNKIYI